MFNKDKEMKGVTPSQITGQAATEVHRRTNARTKNIKILPKENFKTFFFKTIYLFIINT